MGCVAGSISMANSQRMRRVPVTLVTGFLGAGKTTLLHRILDAGMGRRFVIIENEFGDVGIDGSLVNAKCQALFELNDGCVCCSVREDLIAVFKELIANLDDIDHVIIETTGLAEPGPVMRVFELPAIRNAFELDGVITVVDAGHVEASLNDVSACLEQIAFADMLILNKIDQVKTDALASIEAHLRRINPLATIARTEHAKVDVSQLLQLSGRPQEERVPAHLHDTHHDHHHDEAIESIVVEVAGDVDVAALDLWLGQLTRHTEFSLLRMKGILAIPRDPRRFVFNGVRNVVDVRPDRPWGAAQRFSRIVMIGRRLDSATLQAGFESCCATAAHDRLG